LRYQRNPLYLKMIQQLQKHLGVLDALRGIANPTGATKSGVTECDAGVPVHEIRNLLPPRKAIPTGPMCEHDRRTLPFNFVIKRCST
jgi:hypothetical protein